MPTSGRPKMSTSGMKPMSARPMPASDPSRPAWGTIFCTQRRRTRATLMTPIMTMVAMPMYQVIIAASWTGMPPALRDTNAGPSTTSAMPMVDGVSSPRGMAVTCVAGPLGEAERHPGVHQVAEQHPERGAREHPAVHDLGREAEGEDQDAGQEREHRQVVEHQPEKAVDVAKTKPLVLLRSVGHSVFSDFEEYLVLTRFQVRTHHLRWMGPDLERVGTTESVGRGQ